METKRIEMNDIFRLLHRSGFLSLMLIAALAFGLAGSNPLTIRGQDEPAAGDDPPAAEVQEDASKAEATEEAAPLADETLETMLEQWKDLETELISVERDLLSATDAGVIAGLRASYAEKNDVAIPLVAKIETAALAKLAEGDRSKELLELLTGIVINHADFERDQTALDIGQALIDAGIEKTYFDTAATADRLQLLPKDLLRELASRSADATANDLPRVKLVTSKGDIVLELFENEAPDTVGNFVNLVESGYYDGLTFHRVLENFMAQGGDPKGDGSGGPGYTIYCECYKSDYRRHFPGSLSMANTGVRDTGGSQFFLNFVRTPQLDGKHTVFGRIIDGMDVVNSLQRIDPDDRSGLAKPEADKIISAEVLRKRDHDYVPKKVGGG